MRVGLRSAVSQQLRYTHTAARLCTLLWAGNGHVMTGNGEIKSLGQANTAATRFVRMMPRSVQGACY